MEAEKDVFCHIVLVAPEIPQNTGNIGRIACCTGCRLHLVRPVSFSFEDRLLKRAGMDYWKHVDCRIHDSWDDLTREAGDAPFFFFSARSGKSYWDCPISPGSYLVFGSESRGLPPEFFTRYASDFYSIPMPGNFHRSLNLANAVAVAVYEGLRRQKEVLS